MIPFIVVTLFYDVPLKYITGFYRASQNLVKDIFVGQILLYDNNYLWFLPALFLIFTGAYFIDRFFKISHKVLFVSLLIISFANAFVPVPLLQSPIRYAFWFYVGYCFEEKRASVNLNIEKHPSSIWPCVCGFVLIQCLLQTLPEYPGNDMFDVAQRLCRFLGEGLGCYITYFISYVLAGTNIQNQKLFRIIRGNTLGLYLYSEPWNGVVLYFATKYFGNKVFVTNAGAAMLIFSRFIITFTMALAISALLRKCKIKYLY